MKRILAIGLCKMIVFGAVTCTVLGTTGCDNSQVYVGVHVAGPYGGYPYGYPYGGGYGGGVGIYGRPFY